MITLAFLIRLSVAALLGGAIGLEREYRAKEAGFRTHFLVAMGAALFTLLSAYGFEDVLTGTFYPDNVHPYNLRLDVSRIAAQVVTGIGFIGAGVIIFQKPVIRGLTTAAGLWATGAIGMTAACGMYTVAFFTAFLILLALEVSNKFLGKWSSRCILVVFTTSTKAHAEQAVQSFQKEGMELEAFKMEEQNDRFRVTIELITRRGSYTQRVSYLLSSMDDIFIESID